MRIETLKINDTDYNVGSFSESVQNIVAELQVLIDEKAELEEHFAQVVKNAQREAAKIDALSALVQQQLLEAASKELSERVDVVSDTTEDQTSLDAPVTSLVSSIEADTETKD